MTGWAVAPRVPSPPGEEAHVWRAELDAGWPGSQGLPDEERERVERKRRPAAAARWAASRWVLRTVLSRYLGRDPAAIELRSAAAGKPELARDPDRLRFNLSHSDGLALVGVAVGREVGVDVEWIKPDRDFLALADRGLGEAAALAVRAAAPEERPAVFYEAWARHEALAKCLGTGIGGERPKGVDISVCQLDPGPGYAGALAVPGKESPSPRCYFVDP